MKLSVLYFPYFDNYAFFFFTHYFGAAYRKYYYICEFLRKHKTNNMDKKLYLIPSLRFIASRFDENFLASITGGSTIDDATEEEWPL